jgi:hypothetical protein
MVWATISQFARHSFSGRSGNAIPLDLGCG